MSLKDKVVTLIDVNNQILSSINDTDNMVVLKYSITQEDTPPYLYTVIEEKIPIDKQDLIYNWECKHIFLYTPDLFNDRLNYNVSSWNDLLKLFNGMSSIVERTMAFMGDSVNNMPAFEIFLKNLETTQVCLGEIETDLLQEESSLIYYENKVNLLNELILELYENSSVGFTPRIIMKQTEVNNNIPTSSRIYKVTLSDPYPIAASPDAYQFYQCYEVLTSDNELIGVGTLPNHEGWIQASFEIPVEVNRIHIIGTESLRGWGSTYFDQSSTTDKLIQWSNDEYSWVNVCRLDSVQGQRRTYTLNSPIIAQFWRLYGIDIGNNGSLYMVCCGLKFE